MAQVPLCLYRAIKAARFIANPDITLNYLSRSQLFKGYSSTPYRNLIVRPFLRISSEIGQKGGAALGVGAVMSSDGVVSVDQATQQLRKLLQKAQEVKTSGSIEPPLLESDFDGAINDRIFRSEEQGTNNTQQAEIGRQAHYAIIETAVRNIFYSTLATIPIDDPRFIRLWNLLDIVSILSDNEQCEPGLIFWLIEELLDSQTIDGCRKVFDYLESRRERLTAKHFKQKNLIILRSCNELLRRLSRAEDAVFCGRVFIFLFQSFPLGDKSSVNLRGEYHVENVTTFDNLASKDGQIADKANADNQMEVDLVQNDAEAESSKERDDEVKPEVSIGDDNSTKPTQTTQPSPRPAEEQLKSKEKEDADRFYSIFWSLQQDFSNPTRLFDQTYFGPFKSGLETVVEKFKQVQHTLVPWGSARASADYKRSLKRKRADEDDGFASTFNPKYLTNRDLFDLEISDLAFRRHILVQALILLDFLVSLNQRSKSKLTGLQSQNRSVLYSHTLSEEDSAWAFKIRGEVANYLQDGMEGKFYYRMVDTVLSRDKNWVRWKAQSCPPIERPPVSVQEHQDARGVARRSCANKRMRAAPLGSLDLNFLNDAETPSGLEKLKGSDRSEMPSVESFERPIEGDDLDLDMAMTDEDKQLSLNAKASKTWRALRLASRGRLNLFDKIEDGNKLQILFRSYRGEDGNQNQDSPENMEIPDGAQAKQGDQEREAVDDASPKGDHDNAILQEKSANLAPSQTTEAQSSGADDAVVK
ncbi:hypothetical protein L228DRAFT_268158 [Xylona heveae TC161]|uniref:Nuclear matrix protein n=1 Tax=Xylona heveae (strain CBS 132557 / TC161) TaxID=1328760 RepID=A0A165GYW7_XYLHT|nr:hypothetical protein L228DRAFT_268158 [Xylona heveae TC161]KZF22775.1 hypothetical protein L228DRAFT_268158 [Xylona heveae TC161]